LRITGKICKKIRLGFPNRIFYVLLCRFCFLYFGLYKSCCFSCCVHVKSNSCDDDDALNCLDVVRGDAEQDHDVVENTDKQRSEYSAADAAFTAGKVDAADNHDHKDVAFIT